MVFFNECDAFVQDSEELGLVRSGRIIQWKDKINPFLLEYEDEDESNQTWASLPNRHIIFDEELCTHRKNAGLGPEKLQLELNRLCVRDVYDRRILDTIQKLSNITDQEDVMMEDAQRTAGSESEFVVEEVGIPTVHDFVGVRTIHSGIHLERNACF